MRNDKYFQMPECILLFGKNQNVARSFQPLRSRKEESKWKTIQRINCYVTPSSFLMISYRLPLPLRLLNGWKDRACIERGKNPQPCRMFQRMRRRMKRILPSKMTKSHFRKLTFSECKKPFLGGKNPTG